MQPALRFCVRARHAASSPSRCCASGGSPAGWQIGVAPVAALVVPARTRGRP